MRTRRPHWIKDNFKNRYSKDWKFDKARQMRRNPTPAEMELWQHLKGSRLGYPFRRQAVVLGYILDFYCPRKKLALEVDGKPHEQNVVYDCKRDMRLQGMGVEVLRFKNRAVMNNIQKVLEIIRRELQTRTYYPPHH